MSSINSNKPPAHPLPSTTARSPPAALTPDHEVKYEKVLAHLNALESLPVSSAADAVKEPLNETEKFWLTRECLLRYLRATKWDAKAAIKRLEATIVWRRETGLSEGGQLTKPEYVEPEQLTGKQLLYGYDNLRRPLWYMKPFRQNTEQSPRQLHHAYFFLERGKDLMPRGVETLGLLINFAARGQSPSIQTMKTMMYALADHYPESLGTAYVANLPFVITAMFKIISPLLDPVTRAKLSFANRVTHLVPASQLENLFGGEVDMSTYDHSTYWPAVIKLASFRREKMLAKWRELGAMIGIAEWDIKEGEETWDPEAEAAAVEVQAADRAAVAAAES